MNSPAKIHRPTIDNYGELESSYDFFNEQLFVRIFGVRLPHVMLTMPKSNKFAGSFQHDSWSSQEGKGLASEIAINPFISNSPQEFCQTLVHEMVHLGQFEFPNEGFGKPSPRGYHNKSFANAMSMVGLKTSSTGMPSGKKTGNTMSDYVIEGGPFAKAFEQYIKQGFGLSWTAAIVLNNSGNTNLVDPNNPASVAAAQQAKEREQKRRSKTKYTCLSCHINAWAKPAVQLTCTKCTTLLQECSK